MLITLPLVKNSSKQLITSGNNKKTLQGYFKTVPKESAQAQTTASLKPSSSTIEESVTALD